jgi:TetR/AcrR family transcriptional repressor of bet genes
MAQVMGRSGYERSTIQEIAGEAGLSPGLVHYHFKNKLEILTSLVGEMEGFVRQRFERIAAENAGAEARLYAYIDARLGLAADSAPSYVSAWVMIAAEALVQVDVRRLYERVIANEINGVTSLIAACLKDRQKTARGAREAAVGLVALMEGCFQLGTAARDVMPLGRAAGIAKRFARDCLAMHAPAASQQH